MIVGIMSNKKFQAIIKKLFIRCRKLNTSLVFITQFCFYILNDRLNSIHYLILQINNKRVFQNITINHSADMYKEQYSFLTINTTLPANDLLSFRKNLFLSYKNDSSRSN